MKSRNIEHFCCSTFSNDGQLYNNINKSSIDIDQCISSKVSNGFTLAETLITLVILGIVASITIPSLIRNQIESKNKVKIKKALSSYETAINRMVIENGLAYSLDEINNYANNDGACTNAYKYFKPSEKEGCIFKTSDGLWWDIGDTLGFKMTRTMVSFDKNNLTHKEAVSSRYKTFVFITSIDENGSIRVNDVGYEEKSGVKATKQQTQKVKAYLNNEKFDFGVNDAPCFDCTYEYYASSPNDNHITRYLRKYDADGNLIFSDWFGEVNVTVGGYKQWEYEYDKDGKKISQTQCGGSFCDVTKYHYDDEGKVTSETSCSLYRGVEKNCYLGKIYTYENGNLVKENNFHPNGSLWGQQVTYSYNSDNKMIGKTTENTETNIKIEYEYDPNNSKVTSQKYYNTSTEEGNLIARSSKAYDYEYNSDGTVKSQTTTNLVTGEKSTTNYTYDKNGNTLTKKSGASEYTYKYNSQNKKTSEEYVSKNGDSHSYKYEYDKDGNMISSTVKEYDKDGNITKDISKEYQYDKYGGMSYASVCDYTKTSGQCKTVGKKS